MSPSSTSPTTVSTEGTFSHAILPPHQIKAYKHKHAYKRTPTYTHIILFYLLINLIVKSSSPLALPTAFLSRPISLGPLLNSGKGGIKTLESTLTINDKVLHEVSNRLCSSEKSDFPDLPKVGMGGIVVKGLTCSEIKFTCTPPPLLDSTESRIELQPGERVVFFSFDVKGVLELCCVRTCEAFTREVERRVVGGIVMKKAKEGGGGEEEGEGEEVGSDEILEDRRRE